MLLLQDTLPDAVQPLVQLRLHLPFHLCHGDEVHGF